MGVYLISGEQLPYLEGSLDDRMAEGHEMLCKISGKDFGYDLHAWHDFLKVSHVSGYTWNRTIDLPRVMKDALASEDWRAAVARLTEE